MQFSVVRGKRESARNRFSVSSAGHPNIKIGSELGRVLHTARLLRRSSAVFRSGSARCGDVRGAEVLVEPKNQDVGLEFSADDSRSLIMGVPSIGPIPFSWVAELLLTSCPVCWTL